MTKKVNIHLLKWQLPYILMIILLSVFILNYHIPLIMGDINKISGYFKNVNFKKNMSEYSDQLKQISAEVSIIDSLIVSSKLHNQHDQDNIVKALYCYADTVDLKILKFEIGGILQNERHREIPVVITGKGQYESLGKFVEKIENAPQAIRIRQISIRNTGTNILTATINFVILE